MASPLRVIDQAFDHDEKVRLAAFYAAIVLIHLAGWGILFSQAQKFPALIGLGGLAYTFGLRHAFDADHISAIDNTTRKLLQAERSPWASGSSSRSGTPRSCSS